MPLNPTWQDIALRLLLTMIAGAIIGFNRGARGHAAGLRTTMLVGLAASVAMIQANTLLSVGGKAQDFFGTMDLMRLPLGILTGVGFIGAGAILRRGDMVTGVTTAATLWVMTVIGLCLGGGQLWLGIFASALTVLTLWALKWVDRHVPREHRGVLVVSATAEGHARADLAELIAPLGKATFRRQVREDDQRMQLCFDLSWKQPEAADPPDGLIETVDRRYRVISFELTSETRG